MKLECAGGSVIYKINVKVLQLMSNSTMALVKTTLNRYLDQETKIRVYQNCTPLVACQITHWIAEKKCRPAPLHLDCSPGARTKKWLILEVSLTHSAESKGHSFLK